MQIFRLDEKGEAIPDAEIEKRVQQWIHGDGRLLHTSNVLVLHCARHLLVQMPVDERPEIRWGVYGEEVHFDNDLRSNDAWHDSRTVLIDRYFESLLSVKD